MNTRIQAKRIHIIGSAGSGKTTLAQQVSNHLGIPFYELDLVAYEKGFGSKVSLDARVAALQQIIAQPGWVTEGSYLWWTETLLDAADLIIWLDLPYYLNGWRIVYRHLRLNWAGTNRHPSTRKLIRFLLHVMKHQTMRTALVPKAPDDDAATTRVATAQFLSGYGGKVLHYTSPAQVEQFKVALLK